ncbi:hypothetical protein AC579_7525 [Pseudocercospora musae]|uniref:Uncharacterized protein n=1 Tax=Pseudocercospora musae TaxID=113226 RepID=A0A139I7J4_9PEZI|nr:hypothetical protein AC579_7525 [Pseudocercospora musae]
MASESDDFKDVEERTSHVCRINHDPRPMNTIRVLNGSEMLYGKNYWQKDNQVFAPPRSITRTASIDRLNRVDRSEPFRIRRLDIRRLKSEKRIAEAQRQESRERRFIDYVTISSEFSYPKECVKVTFAPAVVNYTDGTRTLLFVPEHSIIKVSFVSADPALPWNQYVSVQTITHPLHHRQYLAIEYRLENLLSVTGFLIQGILTTIAMRTIDNPVRTVSWVPFLVSMLLPITSIVPMGRGCSDKNELPSQQKLILGFCLGLGVPSGFLLSLALRAAARCHSTSL